MIKAKNATDIDWYHSLDAVPRSSEEYSNWSLAILVPFPSKASRSLPMNWDLTNDDEYKIAISE